MRYAWYLMFPTALLLNGCGSDPESPTSFPVDQPQQGTHELDGRFQRNQLPGTSVDQRYDKRLSEVDIWGAPGQRNVDISCIDYPTNCETAFAYGGNKADCFIGMNTRNAEINRWGWTNGPLAEGYYWFSIYAAAGQCDLSKGTNVGTLAVSYHDGTAHVCYHVASGVWLGETHLYVGSDPLPSYNGRPTVAPGLYPYSGSSDGCYTVNGLSGNIYVVAHAETCGTPPDFDTKFAVPY